jgi:hypothetical protein
MMINKKKKLKQCINFHKTKIKSYRFGFTHDEVKDENQMIKNTLSMNNASESEIMKYKVA